MDEELEYLKALLAWAINRYHAKPPYPELVLAKGLIDTKTGETMLGTFGLETGKPTIWISQEAPNRLEVTVSLFHEFQHFLDWKNNPNLHEYTKGKVLPRDHPLEQAHEKTPYEDAQAFIRFIQNRREKSP